MTTDGNLASTNLDEVTLDSFSADLADEGTQSDRYPLGRLDDRLIIWRFAEGKKRLVVNDNLRIDYAHNSLQLSTPDRELIAIHKVAKKLHYILIKKNSKYAQAIGEIITECNFIPIDTTTADRGFIRYQKYEIPAGYTLRYASVAELWDTWQTEQLSAESTTDRLDLSILAKSKWYRVQQMLCVDDRLDIQTRLGLISLPMRERIAWVSKIGNLPTISDADLTTPTNGRDSSGSSEILGKIISKLAIDPTDRDSMSERTIELSEQSSLVYDGDRSSTLTGQLLAPTTESLHQSAIAVLERYLEYGETIVRTETICDPHGNIISQKTTTTQRSCPRWAIEAILGTLDS
jgi:hypothetical protein